MFVYCFIFIILAILAVEYEVKAIQKVNFTLIIVAVLLCLFTGLRGVAVSRDYLPYLGSFSAIMHGDSKGGSGILPLFEPGFVWIVVLCYKLFESNAAAAVMLVFAILTIATKMVAVKRLAINPFIVLLLYYCHYFFIQEMTQIRNGLACSLFFLAIYFHLQNKTLNTVVLILLAMLFHNSAVLYFILFLVRKDKLNGYFYAALLALAVILGLLKIPFLSMLAGFDLNLISNKLTTYVDIVDRGLYDRIRFFNVLNTINVVLTAYFLGYCMWYKIKDPRIIIFLKCNIISIFTYGLLMDIPSVATRFSELFGAVFPFLFAYGMLLFPFKKLNIVVIIGIAVIFLYINLFYGKLLNPYSIIKLQ